MITRTSSGAPIELRAFSLADMTRYGWADSRLINPTSTRDMMGIPAIHRAARLRAEALASLRLCCYSGDGQDRRERDQVWQAKLFHRPANEYQSRFTFWETVGASLAYRNNAYIWKNVDPLSGQVVEWYALSPDQVQCKGPDLYEVNISDGYVDPVRRGQARYEVGSDTVLHILGANSGGMLEAPSPVKIFRSALAGPIGRQNHEGRMWRRGTTMQVGISFPSGVSSQQADEWRESYRSTYEGTNGDTTLVLGNDAKIIPIGMTQADAQFAEMQKLTVEDAARMMAVPANLLGVQLDRAVPNLEQDLMTWLRFGIGPELARIESALEADEQLFGNAQTYPHFDTDDFVRGDVATEAAILVQLVQAGILTPNEARATRGLDDIPGGDIPQLTPVGGAPNPVPAVPAAASNGSNGGSGY